MPVWFTHKYTCFNSSTMLLTWTVRFPRFISNGMTKDRPYQQLPKNIFLFDSRVVGDCQRLFARNYWTGRKHSKVFKPNGEPYVEQRFDDLGRQTLKGLEQPIKHDSNKNNQHGQNQSIFPPNKTIQSFDGIEFVSLKDEDPMFSKSVTKARNRKQRKKNSLIMLEGRRLNQDALNANLVPKKIFFNDKSFLTELDFPEDMKVPLFKISYKVIKLWSQLETPPGIIGFYEMPKTSDIKLKETLPLRVVCDNVRDPGNLGSILRVAAGVGCAQLILMKGCTDPWDSKVLRAASGAHFHLPIKQEVSWSEQANFVAPGDSVFVADSQVNRVVRPGLTLSQSLYHNVDFTSCASITLIIGGETEGVSDDALALTAQRGGLRLHIPLSNAVESLNSGCALSVLLFEIKRQFLLSERNNNQEELVVCQ